MGLIGNPSAVTMPIVSASNGAFTLTFDGRTIMVYLAANHQHLRTIPLAAVLAVSFLPATPQASGLLHLQVRGTPAPSDRIAFAEDQQAAIQHLADMVQQSRQANPMPALVVPPLVLDERSGRALNRWLTLSMWTEGIGLVILLAPLVLICGGCAFVLIR
jgi:hypothetical protein